MIAFENFVYMRRYIDQLGREILLGEKVDRIVSLVPSQTELLVDLGLEERVVGVTKFCVHPKALRKKKKVVGGTKKVHPEKIKALRPDIILCNKEENTEEMVLELEEIAPVHVSDIKTIPDSLQLIGQYGEMFQVQPKAMQLSKAIEERWAQFQNRNKQYPKRRVGYLIWRNPWMAVGADTFIDALLSLNNFENVFAGERSRYPEIGIEDLKERKVELVLLSTEPFPFKEKHKEDLEALLPGQEIKIVDGEFFSWYGSRLLKAFDYFEQLQES